MLFYPKMSSLSLVLLRYCYMCTICPTITAGDPHLYRQEMELAAELSSRVHVDFMDRDFTGVESINLAQAWLPDDREVDLHLMLSRPQDHLETIIAMDPSLAIIHAESQGDLLSVVSELKRFGIKAGVALLPETTVHKAKDLIAAVDHVLIFGGRLGHHGGTAQLELLSKCDQVRSINNSVELAWDGGVNDSNTPQMISAGVDVLNVGGAIQHAEDPHAAYAELHDLANSPS